MILSVAKKVSDDAFFQIEDKFYYTFNHNLLSDIFM